MWGLNRWLTFTMLTLLITSHCCYWNKR
ncbi:EC1118_1B15_0837p [Saccharomyces cerevisiae EC1118]|uniref:EC1118_1B15_0837p n=1 Tax=Saccharomyces cerevisiae (strain Lalvin EC1118 / Prise de mousse) TaxID=643680 RepID=C8Z3R0_YEAS8|nr:EC1118_1B15_0837p [Saccharomyces cerevisiae EC1118]